MWANVPKIKNHTSLLGYHQSRYEAIKLDGSYKVHAVAKIGMKGSKIYKQITQYLIG